MKKLFCFFLTTCIVALLHRADAHGRMNQPPARNVMWRYGFSVPPNYDDFGLNCGGVGVQHQSNGNTLLRK
jgi:predicted carbohydrate-binding protein with CBM5 and CBM33 domain